MPRVIAKQREGFLYALYVMTKPMQKDVKKIMRELSIMEANGRTTYYRINISGMMNKLADFYRMLDAKPGTYFDEELKQLAVKERRLASAQYQATAGTSAGQGEEGIWDYLQGPDFAVVQNQPRGIALLVGDKAKLDEMTSSWQDKYAGFSAKDWDYEREPPYFNTGIGYWRWQEFGARKSRHWLKRTVKWAVRYNIPLSEVGGNIKARHIFLRTISEAKEESEALALKLTQKFASDFSGHLNRLLKKKKGG